MKTDFDIIICGAGPAGCTAALALGSSSLKLAVIEKRSFPREKVCGDAIPAFIPKVLDSIDPVYAEAFERMAEKQKVNKCDIISPGMNHLQLSFPENGYICKRIVFDSFLLDLVCNLSNTTIFGETTVINVVAKNDGVEAMTDKGIILTARLIIGCDGANSIVSRSLTGKEKDFGSCSSAVRAYFRNISGTSSDTFEIHFLRNILPGYFWIFPLPDNTFNVGLGTPASFVSKKSMNLRKELLTVVEKVPYLGVRFSKAELISEIGGSLLPLWIKKGKISGAGYMLCGDAAALANPVTGSGIGQAMQSGRYAGWQALQCFKKNDFSADFIKSYDLTIYDKLWKANRQYLFIRESVIRNAWLLDMVISAGQKSKSIKDLIIRQLK